MQTKNTILIRFKNRCK